MTQEQQFLTDCLIEKMALMITEDFHTEDLEALDMIYNSQFYEKLMDLETGLYLKSALYNYSYLKNELEKGIMV